MSELSTDLKAPKRQYCIKLKFANLLCRKNNVMIIEYILFLAPDILLKNLSYIKMFFNIHLE